MPQNNPNHAESRITLHSTETFLLQQRLLIFIDLTRHFLQLHHLPLCSQLPSPQNFIVIPSEDYYLTPFCHITPPPHLHARLPSFFDTTAPLDMDVFSCFSWITNSNTSHLPRQHPFYMTVINDARSSCVLHFPKFLPLHKGNFHSTFAENRSP